jgi:hypothetical protein
MIPSWSTGICADRLVGTVRALANYEFIQKRIAEAGYIVARNYPNEAQDGHIRPNLQAWHSGRAETGRAAKSEIVDVANLNAKFDERARRNL